ncbi:MAG TPA: hypothetical protein VKB57_28460 [Acidimicrobiales bacterium]|nr:hypothetical protein [Acidimicrobiales bacterium]
MPPGVVPAAHESDCLAWLRGSFLGGWPDLATGATRPFTDGVTFESVDLRGAFRHARRPAAGWRSRPPRCPMGTELPGV